MGHTYIKKLFLTYLKFQFYRQFQFCFSLSKSKSFRFLFSLTKSRNLFEKSKEKYAELWDEYSMKTGEEARSRKQVVSGKSHWMIPLSALCNSAPRTLPVRTMCSNPSNHWKKAKKQSKKVMGNSLGIIRVTERIPTEFGGSLMKQVNTLLNHSKEKTTIQPGPYPALKNPKRWCCESAALNTSANLENSAGVTGLEKVSCHSSPKERQYQRMFKLPHNCTHLAW